MLKFRLSSRTKGQFTWRAAKTRLFNNVAIALHTPEEADEYVQAIGEQIKVTMALSNHSVDLKITASLPAPSQQKTKRFDFIVF